MHMNLRSTSTLPAPVCSRRHEGCLTFCVNCIVSEQPCLNLAAECSCFVHDGKMRNPSQRFGAACARLLKGLVNQQSATAQSMGSVSTVSSTLTIGLDPE